MQIYEPYTSPWRVTVFVGNFGSGKTEVAVNYTIALAGHEDGVCIADLDIVNPYFRCREVAELMQERNVTVIVPPGGLRYADLPVILPEIKGMLENRRGRTVLDVGGDPVGARVLGSLAGSFSVEELDVLIVLNANRPFTDTPGRCVRMMEDIERACRLRITGIVGNTHLMDDTDWGVILQGESMVREVSRLTGRLVRFVTVDEALFDEAPRTGIESAVLVMSRHMLPPWVAATAQRSVTRAHRASENRGILGSVSVKPVSR